MKDDNARFDLRRKLMQVDRYTDGWDIVVGKVMDRVSNLESRVSDLESEVMELRDAADDDLI